MDIKLLTTFIILNIVNVIIQTVKSIATMKCGKEVAALVNAFAYGLYTIVTVYLLCDLPLMWKAGIVAGCNLVGVYLVKWAEEKARKDKLWKIEATFDTEHLKTIHESVAIPHSYIEIGSHVIFNFYAENQRQSAIVKDIINKYKGKYFVSETKIL
jgi:hypothetical protein